MAVPHVAQGGGEETSARLPDWREVLAILLERVWIGLAVAAVVFCLALIQLRRTIPQYRSTAVLLVESQAPRILNYQDVLSSSLRNLEYFNTVINTLHSRKMVERAVRMSALENRNGFFPGIEGVEGKAAAALGLVSILPVEKSRLINVTVVHQDPQIASDLANAMAAAYIQQDLDDRMQASMQSLEWLKERSLEYRGKLEKGLMALQKHREDAGSVSLEEDQNIVVAKLKALNVALTQAQTERIDAETRWKAVQTQADAGIPKTKLAVQLNDEAVSGTLAAWRTQQQSVALLRQRYKPEFPELRDAVETEEQLREQFEEACGTAVFALRSRYEMLKAREESLLSALQEQERQAFSLARQLIQYDDLKRNVEADREIYQSVISRMKETSVSETLPTQLIRVAEEARPAARPFRPQASLALLRGTLLGLALGIGVIFLSYYSDHRLRRTEEVERTLGVPVLASVPVIPGQTIRERGLICHLKRKSETAEAFRTLRAVLQVTPSLKAAKVLMVSSSQPGDGKSLISTNLAISLAQDNRRTLLVGCDLRRPAYEQLFDAQTMPPGLAEVLKGETTWKAVLQSGMVLGLDILPAGKSPANPSELLGSVQLSALMVEFRNAYEYVVLDASPIIGVSDALLLLGHADGVLFTVRQGVTHSQSATYAVKRIVASGTPCLGALMNGVNPRTLGSYYGYGRYGAYAYRPERGRHETEADS